MARTVVVLCGPPGAGKTTAARESGLAVFDRDDPQWTSEKHFTQALAKLASDPRAQAVVIRSGATSQARARAADLVRATHVLLLLQDKAELAARVRNRGRNDTLGTLAGITSWFQRFDRRDGVSSFTSWSAIHEPDLGAMSEDW